MVGTVKGQRGADSPFSLKVIQSAVDGWFGATENDLIWAVVHGNGEFSIAFFYAGAPALVVSLWTVNDESTAELMQRFYEMLQTGHSVTDSLRRAQLDMMSRFHHPYFWASFCATGDGRVSLPP